MSLSSQEAEALLKPYENKYVQTFNAGQFEDMKVFYHNNAVLIEKDKSVLFGKNDIAKSLKEMATECGKTEMTLFNSKYEGVGDFVNFRSDFEFHTEKSGVLKGRFLQIWRKIDGVYAIYHDEYEMI